VHSRDYPQIRAFLSKTVPNQIITEGILCI
jgi:hypothetical protein